MKKLMFISLAAALALAGTGCTNIMPQGSYVDNDVRAAKVGTASRSRVLGFYPSGDGGVDAAMKEGNISKVHHVDYEDYWFPVFYWSRTTKVYGE